MKSVSPAVALVVAGTVVRKSRLRIEDSVRGKVQVSFLLEVEEFNRVYTFYVWRENASGIEFGNNNSSSSSSSKEKEMVHWSIVYIDLIALSNSRVV